VPNDPEYAGSVILIITGRKLDLARVTEMIRLKPFQSWLRGERKRSGQLVFSSLHHESGWKAKPPASVKKSPLEKQLRWWARRLATVSSQIRSLKSQGCYCRLSWFAATGSTVSLAIPNELQAALLRLNLDWEVSVVSSADQRAPANKRLERP
jgi:Domain of unknown function (DUF4279)